MRSVVDDALAWLGAPGRAPRVVAAVPLSLLLLQVGGGVLLDGLAVLGRPDVLPGIVIHGIVVGAVLVGAVRLSRVSLSPARYPRLIGWYVGGAVLVAAINLLLIAFFPANTLAGNLGWFAFAATMGAGSGFVVGHTEARAIERAVAAERDAAEAELLAEQRDRFEYMNALLRHEVLNNVQVIHGNAEYLKADAEDPDIRDRLGIISRQSDDMAAVIEDVRVVSQGLENTDLEPIDLAAVLRTELVDLEDAHDAVETDLDCPESVHVVGDTLLARVFSNLFANAVEHNDDGDPRIEVRVEEGREHVAVEIADNGPGISERMRETLFDRGAGPHGVGLYLVDTLVSHYGGDVELTETGPDGTVFTVELERAAPDGEPAAATASGRETTRDADEVARGADEVGADDTSAYDTETSVVGDDGD